ncbi:MAG: type IV pilus modification protein PilV [Gammaproteobacteria bacterium]|nr:type IV pilus modification protein PilV [Gammaproteobacteria bacterium]MCP5423864.1 type IV pilus modification protein PilV [Gammaproteobacteria bacterium]
MRTCRFQNRFILHHAGSDCGQRGFTLLEVLVALIILAIGLLGLASLQAVGLRSNHSAQMRTQATLLSYDIVDRIRANLKGAKDGYYNNNGGNAADNGCIAAGANCDPQAMAEQDLFEWNAAIANVLPSGAGIVCVDSTPDDDDATLLADTCDGVINANESVATAQYVVRIQWVDDQSGTLQRFATTFRPSSSG